MQQFTLDVRTNAYGTPFCSDHGVRLTNVDSYDDAQPIDMTSWAVIERLIHVTVWKCPQGCKGYHETVTEIGVA